MKIDRLHLTSFRSFQDVELPTSGPRVVFGGTNGVGKSSIAEMLRWTLLGRCDLTDARGVGAELLQPTDGQGVTVAVDLSGVGRVTRFQNNGSSGFTVSDFKGDKSTQQAGLFAKLETTPEFVDAVLDTGFFLGLDHVRGKSFVLGLLDVRIALGETAEAPVYTLDQLEMAYTDAFEARKLAKIHAKGVVVPPAPAERHLPSVEDIRAQLSVLRGKIEDAVRASGASGSQRADLQAQLDRARAKVFPVPSSEELQSLRDTIADLEERLGQMEDQVQEAVQTLPMEAPVPEAGVARLSFLTKQIDALAAHEPKRGCVLNTQVPCKTPTLQFNKLRRAFEAELEEMNAAGVVLPDADPEMPVTTLNTLRVVRKELEMTQARLRTGEDMAGKEQARLAEIARLEALLAELPAVVEGPSEVETLRGRITKGETLLRETEAYVRAVEAHEKGLAEKRTLEGRVAELEHLCDQLGPKGIRVQALQEAIGRFDAAVNAFTGGMGYEVHFVLEPWGVMVNGRPVQTYSESQQFRIGLAIQFAVAMLSGLKFAVVDRLDMLDQATRKEVSQLILQAPLDQVFLLTTMEPTQPLPKREGVVAYRLGLEGQRTVVLEPRI